MTKNPEQIPIVEPPEAKVLEVLPNLVVVECPLCGNPHRHSAYRNNRVEHRVAACGIWAPVSQSAKALGYQYTVRKLTKE